MSRSDRRAAGVLLMCCFLGLAFLNLLVMPGWARPEISIAAIVLLVVAGATLCWKEWIE